MIVNCPRCGFSQPQDQYCARCGIDMVAFKPARKPLYQKILGSTVFQISILVLVVASVFSVARKNRHRELAERVAEIENARNTQILSSTSSTQGKTEMASAKGHSRAASSTTGAAASAPAPPASESPVPRPSGASAAAGFVSGASDEGKGAGGSSSRPAKAAGNLVVTFGEIHRSALGEIIAAAEPNSGTLQGPILAGVVQGLGARLKALQGTGQWEALDASSHSIKAAQVAEFYGGQREESSGQFLGFVVEANPTQLDETESRLQLRVWRNLREANGQPDEFAVPLPESFTVPNGGAIFIAGSQLLPRRQLSDLERRLYDPMKVLHVLATEEYRQGASELLIMIEPR